MPRTTLTFRSPMPAPRDDLHAWHTRPAAFARLLTPWEEVRVVDQKGSFGDGYTLTMQVKILGPIRARWSAEVFDHQPPDHFRDRQLSGPFGYWQHTHRFLPDGPNQSILEDDITLAPPFGWLGQIGGGWMIRDRVQRLFAYRHAITASDLWRHALYRSKPRLHVAITGSRGMVGTNLCRFLNTGGHRVTRLVRGAIEPSIYDDGTTSVSWDPNTPLDPRLLEGVDAVVHLAGENIAGRRWSQAQKEKIIGSRVGPTRHLAEAIAKLDRKPALISASAVGIYGDRGDEELRETSPAGTGFFAETGTKWEAACDPARQAGARVANLRFGVILSPEAGALQKQLFAFQMGGGAVLGSGRQWLSWISIGDTVGAIHHVLMNETLEGPFNLTSPEPVTNRVFGRILAQVLGRPYLLTIPAPALRLIFGEMAQEALLASTRVLPGRLTETGFTFDHPDLATALRFVLGKNKLKTK